MFKVFFKTYEISLAQKFNMFIYYTKKIPFLVNKIPNTLYNTSDLKLVLSIIIRIFSFLLGFAKKLIYIFTMIIIPSMLISEKTGINASSIKFHIFFFLSFVTGALLNNRFTHDAITDFYMINLMRINPKKYYLSEILFSYLEYLIYFIFPIMLLNCTFIESLIITLEFIAFRSITQTLHVLIYNCFKFQLSNKWYFIAPVIIIPLTIAYGVPFIGFSFNSKTLLINIPFIFIIFVLSIISFLYLFSYKNYSLLSKNIISKNDLNTLNTVSSEAMFMDVKLNEKNLSKLDLKNDKHKEKHGLHYLNAKFIERHKKIIINPIKRRVIIIAILSIIASIFAITTPESNKHLSSAILRSTGFLVFILYCSSIGEKITKAFFFNCDNSLLRYNFYRESNIILSNFKSRLKITIILNLIPAICIGLGLSLVLMLANGNIIRFIPIFISIITLSCFFSIHYLFLYYITQPYTSQLTIKSPIYKIASFIVYIATYTCLQVDTHSIWFTLAVILVTIIYAIIALILVYKLAPKNFKLK